MEDIKPHDFIAKNKVNLKEIPTRLEIGASKKQKKKALKKVGKKLSKSDI